MSAASMPFTRLPTLRRGPRPAFLTMEFLDGITLADKIRESGPLPWREVKTIALEICEGLRVMHEAGIIHRDLKSRNVMLAERNGTVKAVIMDFGLAHEVTATTSETATDVIREQGVAGTVEYMAPEQFAGEALTLAADIFALGVVMYELATGTASVPVEHDPSGRYSARTAPACPVIDPEGLPHRCDEIICRCLEFDPKKRMGRPKELAEALAEQSVLGYPVASKIRTDSEKSGGSPLASSFAWRSPPQLAYLTYRSNLYKPPSAETKRWYERGLAALREGTYLQAIRALQMAVEHDKSFCWGMPGLRRLGRSSTSPVQLRPKCSQLRCRSRRGIYPTLTASTLRLFARRSRRTSQEPKRITRTFFTTFLTIRRLTAISILQEPMKRRGP